LVVLVWYRKGARGCQFLRETARADLGQFDAGALEDLLARVPPPTDSWDGDLPEFGSLGVGRGTVPDKVAVLSLGDGLCQLLGMGLAHAAAGASALAGVGDSVVEQVQQHLDLALARELALDAADLLQRLGF
jgi:hypothetical protein